MTSMMLEHLLRSVGVNCPNRTKLEVFILEISITKKLSHCLETGNFPCISAAAFMLQLKPVFCCSSLVDAEELVTIFHVKITTHLQNFLKSSMGIVLAAGRISPESRTDSWQVRGMFTSYLCSEGKFSQRWG